MNGTLISKITLLAMMTIEAAGVSSPAQTIVTWPNGTVHNFGDIGEDMGAVNHRFAMVNVGEDALAILSAKGRCNCTTASFDKRAARTGDSLYVDVKFDPTGRAGYFNQRVTVLTTTDHRPHYLFVKGNILTSQQRIKRDFPHDLGGGIRLKTDTIKLQLTSRRTISTTLAGINNGSTEIEPRIADAPRGIDVEVIPAKVPVGQRFSVVLKASRKALRAMMPSRSFTLLCDSFISKKIEITICENQ